MERIGELQAVAQHPVEAGMSQDDETRQLQPLQLEVGAQEEQGHGDPLVMGQVVGQAADSRVDQVADHADVGRQEEDEEPPPGVIQAEEEIDGQQSEQQFFEFDECFHNGLPKEMVIRQLPCCSLRIGYFKLLGY